MTYELAKHRAYLLKSLREIVDILNNDTSCCCHTAELKKAIKRKIVNARKHCKLGDKSK